MDDKFKAWVDRASYEELLRRWRFAPIGDPIFTGEEGEYLKNAMNAKRALLTIEEQAEASKRLGWGR